MADFCLTQLGKERNRGGDGARDERCVPERERERERETNSGLLSKPHGNKSARDLPRHCRETKAFNESFCAAAAAAARSL